MQITKSADLKLQTRWSAGDRAALIVARVRAIPPGFVRTYGDIEPRAPRYVGYVLATTNESLPWHRVVRADGTVAKGERQLTRLRREGVPMRGNVIDLARARLPPAIAVSLGAPPTTAPSIASAPARRP